MKTGLKKKERKVFQIADGLDASVFPAATKQLLGTKWTNTTNHKHVEEKRGGKKSKQLQRQQWLLTICVSAWSVAAQMAHSCRTIRHHCRPKSIGQSISCRKSPFSPVCVPIIFLFFFCLFFGLFVSLFFSKRTTWFISNLNNWGSKTLCCSGKKRE